MSNLLPSFSQHISQPYPQMISAVRCLKAEGLKTALLTNNWFNTGPQDSYIPVDLSLFDVVGKQFTFMVMCYFQMFCMTAVVQLQVVHAIPFKGVCLVRQLTCPFMIAGVLCYLYILVYLLR